HSGKPAAGRRISCFVRQPEDRLQKLLSLLLLKGSRSRQWSVKNSQVVYPELSWSPRERSRPDRARRLPHRQAPLHEDHPQLLCASEACASGSILFTHLPRAWRPLRKRRLGCVALTIWRRWARLSLRSCAYGDLCERRHSFRDLFESRLGANASHKYGDDVAEEGDLKKRLIALGLGILVLGIVFGLGLLSSGDIRVIYIAGAVALLGGAGWVG